MQSVTVATETQRRIRQRELAAADEKEAQEREEARKNKGFTQVYSKGWRRVRELSKGNAGAAGLYAFFAEHIDPTCGAVVCDQQFLADHLEVSTRTIRNWLKCQHQSTFDPLLGLSNNLELTQLDVLTW